MKHHQNPLHFLTVVATVLSVVNPTLASTLALTGEEIESNENISQISIETEENNLFSQEISAENNTNITLNLGEQTDIIENNNLSIPAIIAQSTPDQPTNPTNNPPPQPEILFPNPTITIDGRPAPTANPIQPVAPAPPFLPRAVAPPVGDIAVSNIDSSPEYVDLGTAARVPRLVLREAPVQEVLSLLARAADLNVVYTNAAAEGTAAGATSSNITLDLENESVQDVFNSVLIVSGLQATRRGRTIFIGAALPVQARDLVTRSFRLNQVKAEDAQIFLTGEVGGTIGREPLLTGMQVIAEPRLNAITLVGEPRQIEIASKFLVQLDARQRQVAVNVKIVDVNLLNTESVNTSFSFGIANNFFSVNNGTFSTNYGNLSPATASSNLGVSPPIVANQLSDATIFLDPTNFFTVPSTAPGTQQFLNGVLTGYTPRSDGTFFVPTTAIGTDPFSVGITDITQATDTVITTTTSATAPPTISTSLGTPGSITTSLANYIQYPTKFLASLDTQITNGSAKILTDPTLVIQSGQTASINLTQEVFGGFEIQYIDINEISTPIQRPIIKEAGLQLGIIVEGIDDNGFITLQVKPIVSAPGNEVATNQGPITLIQSRTLESGSIRMRDGQTLILAGIIQESDRASVTKVPILGDIPILGALFRSSSTTYQRNEVIVLVTPQILDDSEQAGWGYNYVPGEDARGMLEDRGFYVPTPNF